MIEQQEVSFYLILDNFDLYSFHVNSKNICSNALSKMFL